MTELEILQKKLERERAARKSAESILESKALELYKTNEELVALNLNLESEITKRTESLAISEERYRNLVEYAQDLIYNVDENGIFTYINPNGLKKLGYTEEDILGIRFLDLLPDEDQALAGDYFKIVVNEKIKSDYQEFRVKAKDDSIFWIGQNVNRIDQSDQSFYFNVVARDITKRRKTEEALETARLALQKSEVKYRSIIENMELGLMEVDKNGIILHAYDRFNTMLGYEEGELTGRNAKEALLVPGYEAVIDNADSKRLQGETSVYEIQIRKKNNEIIWVLISGAPFYNEKGEVAGSIGVHYNITERKRLEQELNIARSNAVRAQQAEKAFLANMSHEIRTPLNAIIGMSHLLLDTPLNEEQQDYLEALTGSTTILKSLISDVLDISKIDSGQLEVHESHVDLASLTNQLIATFKTQSTDKQITFDLYLDPNLKSQVITDAQLINQVLLNLLSNAQKFTESGSIKLSVDVQKETNNSVFLKFSVTDTGIGISKEDTRIIFEEFKQASSFIRQKYGGTGLGLSISHQLVKLLGGELEVDSTLGEGSSFHFELLLDKAAQSVNNTVEANKSLSSKIKKGKILIVEDNEMNLKYINSLCKKWNIDFDNCNNGQEACALSDKNEYSLIFMDLQMPIMDGFEAAQYIRNSDSPNRRIPIVALTASTFLSKKRLALKAGMSDFLSKPFTPDQLAYILEKNLESNITTVQNDDRFSFHPSLDLAYLNEAYSGDFSYALDMFKTFLEIIDEEMVIIKNAVVDRNELLFKSLLHKIKPTFTMVGLKEISEFIAKKELDMTNNADTNMDSWIKDFSTILDEKLPLIKSEANKLESWLEN